MRIAYGVMGYGRGHAMRSLCVLPALCKQHEVTVFTAGDAYEVLAPRFPTVRIPMIGYRYNGRGRHSLVRTVGENAGPMADLLLRGPGLEQVKREFRERGIQIAISDSEAWTHRAAQDLKIPRISFDHVGIIAWCKPHFPADLWLAGMRDSIGYRAFMGQPERILISSFYPAEPRRDGVRIVGPMLRDEVLRTEPAAGDDLLVYFNKGAHQWRPHIERALRLLDRPVKVYGTPYTGRVDNLEFRPLSTEWFVHDLAHCHAVICTAGNQLIGEAIHFGKPILALPENAFEQRLNACMIERMGVGQRGDLATLTCSDIDRFLGNHGYHRSHMKAHAGNGRAEAIETLERFVRELVRPARSRSGRVARPPVAGTKAQGLRPAQ